MVVNCICLKLQVGIFLLKFGLADALFTGSMIQGNYNRFPVANIIWKHVSPLCEVVPFTGIITGLPCQPLT